MPPGEASGVLVRQSADAPLRSDPGPVHGPDGLTYQAPVTFDTRGDADAFLATIRASAQEFGLTRVEDWCADEAGQRRLAQPLRTAVQRRRRPRNRMIRRGATIAR